MNDADRQRLAAILGMLGSEHAGERAAAALQAEAFRKKHGLTWEEMLTASEPPTITIPEPPQWTPSAHQPPAPMAAGRSPDERDGRILSIAWMGVVIGGGLILIQHFLSH